MGTPKMRLKLLVDTKENRVLFAEAKKDFADFLFNILSLPMGTITRLLTTETMAGSLGNLYRSIENMSSTYIESYRNKNALLDPIVTAPYLNKKAPRLLPDVNLSTPKKFYKCSSTYKFGRCFDSIADEEGAFCPGCHNPMTGQMEYVETPEKVYSRLYEGFVNRIMTYMVTDDLVVAPTSSISVITLLLNLNVKDLDALKEKAVDLGVDEGLQLLKASLQSKMVLTDVFLEKNPVKYEPME